MLKQLIKKLFNRFSADLSDSAELGKWGEKQAARYLKKHGYTILEKNFTCKTGELDIVAADFNGIIIFVEVKTRTNENFINAEAAVGYKKRTRMNRAAKYFMAIHQIKNRPYRFDVITVITNNGLKKKITHFPNAFVM
ncbi:MAG: YraN family protein [Phycisphaerae bacterium]|nr:YraN family protein [Phycisphaerae bacterium]